MACHCREGDLLQVLRSLIPLAGLVGGQGRGRGETPSQHLGIASPLPLRRMHRLPRKTSELSGRGGGMDIWNPAAPDSLRK